MRCTMPNVVDPNTFFDKDGKLWMIYGSYSGGIFILEMDATTGLPLPEPGLRQASARR
jgi:arabinan endo-1,5-alpha-L-arabinosidase